MNCALEYLAANYDRLGLERLGLPLRPTCVMLTPRFRLSRHIVVLVLARGDAVLVAKLPRAARDGGALAREARVLVSVQRALAGHDAGTAPALVCFDDQTAYPLLLETALSGVPMSPPLVRRDRDALVACVVTWLGRLAARTRTTPAGGDAWYDRLVCSPLHALASRAGAEVRTMIDRTLERAEPLRFASLPLVLEHGDLGHPNLLRQADGRLGVLDWECGRSAGLPAHDLFFFLAYAALAGRRRGGDGERLADLRAAFFGPRPWAWAAGERYAAQIGIDAALLRPLLAVSCARAVAASYAPSGSIPRRAVDAYQRMMSLWRCAVGGAA